MAEIRLVPAVFGLFERCLANVGQDLIKCWPTSVDSRQVSAKVCPSWPNLGPNRMHNWSNLPARLWPTVAKQLPSKCWAVSELAGFALGKVSKACGVTRSLCQPRPVQGRRHHSLWMSWGPARSGTLRRAVGNMGCQSESGIPHNLAGVANPRAWIWTELGPNATA